MKIMNVFKKIVLITGVLLAGYVSAQNSGMRNIVKLRINGGYSLGKQSIANVGVDLNYQYLMAPGFGIGVVTGYNHFFGKDNKINQSLTLRNNDVGVVPLALLFRFYPQQIGFYIGADAGYGVLVGNKKVAENSNMERPNGGLYIKPEIGWHNEDWNVYLHYTKVFTGKDKGKILNQTYDVSSIGVGVSYNISLGQ